MASTDNVNTTINKAHIKPPLSGILHLLSAESLELYPSRWHRKTGA
jgi:hypothetical protein